jgi:hypothetical protein
VGSKNEVSRENEENTFDISPEKCFNVEGKRFGGKRPLKYSGAISPPKERKRRSTMARPVNVGKLVSQLTALLLKLIAVIGSAKTGSVVSPAVAHRGPGRPKGSKNAHRGPGRPKGSKNAPKAKRGRPVGSKNKVVAESTSTETPAKRGPGRPKGSKNSTKTEGAGGRPASKATLIVRKAIETLKTAALKTLAQQMYETPVEGERVASPRKVKAMLASFKDMDGRKVNGMKRLIVSDEERSAIRQMKSEGVKPKALGFIFHLSPKEVMACLTTEVKVKKSAAPAKKSKIATASVPTTPVAAPVAAPAVIEAPAEAVAADLPVAPAKTE